MQTLEFGGKDKKYGIKFDRDKREAWYVCKSCLKRIDEWQKTEMLKKGKYIHKYPDRVIRGFKVNSLYSPYGWLSWWSITEEFLNAIKEMKRGNIQPYKVWINTRMADWWEEIGEKIDDDEIKARVEPAVGNISDKILCITAGADIQDNRIEAEVVGFGLGEESWSLEYYIMYGDPERQDVWDQLDEVLKKEFTRKDGVKLKISGACVDSGAHTQAVYRFCKTRIYRRILPSKGASTAAKPIISPPSKSMIKKGIPLYLIGTDTAKDMIYGRLKIKEPGPGYCHFPDHYPGEYFKQLSSEKLVKKWVNGKKVREWVKIRKRNEVLDCRVGALAALYAVGSKAIRWGEDSSRVQKVRRRVTRSKGIS
jgi:phage terminase large subunit GpA-like protein